MTVPIPRARSAEAKVPNLAVQLARVAHFRSLDLPAGDVQELDFLAFALLGDVGDSLQRGALWEQLQEPAIRLWHLICDDWDDRDLDELTDRDAGRFTFATQQHEVDHRYCLTRERLEHEIESAVLLARLCTREVRRSSRRLPTFPPGYAPKQVA